jgi:rhodanese-related sulfurtransferase
VSDGTYAGEMTPKETWKALADEPAAMLIDVRSGAEWTFVGTADLSSLGKEPILVPWQVFPGMDQNPEFAAAIGDSGVAMDAPLYFMCRSGARSLKAAIALTAAGYTRCYNVTSGFEGDTDDSHHRGTTNGWKADGLAWVQR